MMSLDIHRDCRKEIERLNALIKSYASGQVWYANALDKLSHLRFHLNELVEQMDSNARLDRALGVENQYQTSKVNAAKIAIKDANKFFSGEVPAESHASLQAKIDALMLEYCPDEMTKEQMDNWASHQVAVKEA